MTRLGDRARARGVTRIVHFTAARNLPQIIDDGALLPVTQLRASGSHFTATDPTRYDGHPGCTCCSVEYPNPYYLRIAQRRPGAQAYPDWVALLLSVDLLDRPGILLSPRNAAARTAVPGNVASFDALYAPTVSGQQEYRRGPRHLAAVPTDLQAEVLIPGPILLSQVAGLMFPRIQSLRDVRANLVQLHRCAPSHWTWSTSPESFDTDQLRRCVHGGIPPKEYDHG